MSDCKNNKKGGEKTKKSKHLAHNWMGNELEAHICVYFSLVKRSQLVCWKVLKTCPDISRSVSSNTSPVLAHAFSPISLHLSLSSSEPTLLQIYRHLKNIKYLRVSNICRQLKKWL